MPIESGKYKEEEKKKKKISEKEKTFEKKKKLDLNKNKEKFKNSENSEKELNKLKTLLEEWKLDESTKQLIEKIVESDSISAEEIQEIFDKIDEIENDDNISKYLPQEFRITKDEYKKSLTSDIVRLQTLIKLSTALTILSNQINPDSSMWLNLFSGFIAVLDKNLIKIQENNIDIKNSLQKVENKKKPPKKLTLWESIKEFFK